MGESVSDSEALGSRGGRPDRDGRRTSGNGWSLCSDPFTARDIGHRTSGACIFPKPGKREKRPLGVPCVNDRALQHPAFEDFAVSALGALCGGGAVLLLRHSRWLARR